MENYGGGGYRRDRNRLQQSVRYQYFLRGSQRGGILPCPVRNEKKRAINIAEIVPKESKKAVPLEETRMQELFRAIHVGDQEKIRKEAIKETEKLHKNAATISQYNLATMEIVSGFFKFCANNSMDFNEFRKCTESLRKSDSAG